MRREVFDSALRFTAELQQGREPITRIPNQLEDAVTDRIRATGMPVFPMSSQRHESELSAHLFSNVEFHSLFFGIHCKYARFECGIPVNRSGINTDPISDEWEVGVAVGKSTSRFEFSFLKFERQGLGYRFSSNGELSGITFIVRSVFDLSLTITETEKATNQRPSE